MGILTNKDARLFRNFFKEMAKLRGINVKYRYVESSNVSIHSEFKSKLSEPIDLNIIFDENPTVNTLKALGWVSENSEDKPYTAQLPFDTPCISVEAVIEIPPFLEIDSRSRKFKITSIKTLLEYPDCWTCLLAPIFDTKYIPKEYKDSNYNYVTSDDQPQFDSTNNKEKSYYTFLNIEGE